MYVYSSKQNLHPKKSRIRETLNLSTLQQTIIHNTQNPPLDQITNLQSQIEQENMQFEREQKKLQDKIKRIRNSQQIHNQLPHTPHQP